MEQVKVVHWLSNNEIFQGVTVVVIVKGEAMSNQSVTEMPIRRRCKVVFMGMIAKRLTLLNDYCCKIKSLRTITKEAAIF